MSIPTRLRLSGAALATAAVLAACGDSPSLPRPGTSYLLVEMDGRAVPAATDSVENGDYMHWFRITYRSLHFFSADSAVYTAASDAYALSPTRPPLFGWWCESRRVRVRRQGSRMIVSHRFDPWVENGSPPGADTLEMIGGNRLRHALREEPTIQFPNGRTFQLVYQPAEVEPGCPELPFQARSRPGRTR